MSNAEDFHSRKMKKKIECFVDVIKEQKSAMFRLAFLIVLNREDAEDVVSEAVLKAYSHLQDLQQIKKMKSWLFQIVVNESKNCLKKRNRMDLFSQTIWQNEMFATSLEEHGYESSLDEEHGDLFEFVCLLACTFDECREGQIPRSLLRWNFDAP